LFPYNLEESIQIALPQGFEVSEMPENVLFESEFGSYSLQFLQETGHLKVDRKIQMIPMRIPLNDCEELIAFDDQRIKADQSTVVLERP
jgi:hypothetical protein